MGAFWAFSDKQSFNRTIKELKPPKQRQNYSQLTSFNRTIKELKPGKYTSEGYQLASFNRTIKELKLVTMFIPRFSSFHF